MIYKNWLLLLLLLVLVIIIYLSYNNVNEGFKNKQILGAVCVTSDGKPGVYSCKNGSRMENGICYKAGSKSLPKETEPPVCYA